MTAADWAMLKKSIVTPFSWFEFYIGVIGGTVGGITLFELIGRALGLH